MGAGAVRVALVAVAIALLSAGCDDRLLGPDQVPAFEAVTAGDFHVCALDGEGAAWCWGSNDRGQLGTGGTGGVAPSPVRVVGGHRFVDLAAGGAHTCGVRGDGRTLCWGAGGSGQLGTGRREDRSRPVRAADAAAFVRVTAGGAHSCALTGEGDAWCWGANDRGQLGTGGREPSDSPRAVPGGISFVALDAGVLHTCGISGSGTGYCWGANGSAQLGLGTLADVRLPAVLSQRRIYASVAAGFRHSCGVTTGAAGVCWGGNDAGQLGDGSRTLRGNPTEIAGDRAWGAVEAGPGFYSCGLDGDGRAWCWGAPAGADSAGEPPSGSPAPSPAGPEGQRYRELAVGVGHACGLTFDGAVRCWGPSARDGWGSSEGEGPS